jgi:hypothetical protein
MDVFLNQIKYCTADKKLNSVGKIVSPVHKINKIVLFTCLHDVAMHFQASRYSIKNHDLEFSKSTHERISDSNVFAAHCLSL